MCWPRMQRRRRNLSVAFRDGHPFESGLSGAAVASQYCCIRMQPFPHLSIDPNAAEPSDQQRFADCAVQQTIPVSPHVGGMTMDTGLSRIELAGLGRFPAIVRLASGFSGRPENGRYFGSGFVWLPAALIAGLGAWTLLSGYASKPAVSEPARLAAAVAAEPAPSPEADRALAVPAFNPPTAADEAITPEDTAPVDGLKISSQYWRRGGLGSNALVTFTLRNRNDYAVKDIAISCAFSRRDGSHLTDRTRMIHDIINTRSRKTFARMHIGFVNINADKANCSPIAARHI